MGRDPLKVGDIFTISNEDVPEWAGGQFIVTDISNPNNIKCKRYAPLDETCGMCGKAITYDEYVVNWGSCNECFDADYEEYLRTHPQESSIEEEKDFS